MVSFHNNSIALFRRRESHPSHSEWLVSTLNAHPSLLSGRLGWTWRLIRFQWTVFTIVGLRSPLEPFGKCHLENVSFQQTKKGSRAHPPKNLVTSKQPFLIFF